jgi:hypothetical protein
MLHEDADRAAVWKIGSAAGVEQRARRLLNGTIMDRVDLLQDAQLDALLPGAIRARILAESPEQRRATGDLLLTLLRALDDRTSAAPEASPRRRTSAARTSTTGTSAAGVPAGTSRLRSVR